MLCKRYVQKQTFPFLKRLILFNCVDFKTRIPRYIVYYAYLGVLKVDNS